MPIAYEEVDNLARLPFKFFKRANYAPKAPPTGIPGSKLIIWYLGRTSRLSLLARPTITIPAIFGLLTVHRFMPRRGTKTGLIM